MSIESSADWDGLRASSRVTSRTLSLLMHAVAPDITTVDLDRLAAAYLRECGAFSAPARTYGFPGSVLVSVNDEVVHGVPGGRRLRAGDLVSLDVTVELDGYVTDAARSLVVGSATGLAHQLTECARAAFDAALPEAVAGRMVNRIGHAVEAEVRRRRFAVVKGLAGHGVGRAIHEPPSVPNEWDPHLTDVLTDGLVITIEPMVCAGSGRVVRAHDGWTIRTRDRSLAAHYEDTIVITRRRPVVLTTET